VLLLWCGLPSSNALRTVSDHNVRLQLTYLDVPQQHLQCCGVCCPLLCVAQHNVRLQLTYLDVAPEYYNMAP
jgi:hypothetical protein